MAVFDARLQKRILGDVAVLISYHPKINSPGAGKPQGNTKPLLHACTVLTYTAWEVYIEDLLLEAVPFLTLDKSFASKSLRDLINLRVAKNPWKLAGDSWKSELQGAVKSLSIGDGKSWGMNSANSKNVIDVFETVFGAKLLDRCTWKGMPANKVLANIDLLVSRRGSIVHRGSVEPSDSRLNLSLVKEWADWIGRLIDRMDTVSASALTAIVGVNTW